MAWFLLWLRLRPWKRKRCALAQRRREIERMGRRRSRCFHRFEHRGRALQVVGDRFERARKFLGTLKSLAAIFRKGLEDGGIELDRQRLPRIARRSLRRRRSVRRYDLTHALEIVERTASG